MEIKKVQLSYKDGKSKKLSIGSTCVIIEDNKVLLVRGKGGNHYKFPGGHIDDTENFKTSAIREAKEEIGIDVEVSGDPYFFLFEFNEDTDIILIHYRAKIINGKPQTTDEIEEVEWFDIDELPENTFDNVRPVLNHFLDSDL